MTSAASFAIASRKSPLAQIQARAVQSLLATQSGLDPQCLPVRTFVTSGDQNLKGSLAAIGGKGLFTKEIEEALLSGVARFAVHSLKDMPAEAPEELVIAAVPAREDPRDSFLSSLATSPWDLPDGAIIGAASVRRIAQVLARRPDLKIVTLRGNVETRLEKLVRGDADGTFLALAGLKRLGLEDKATTIMAPEEMLPAAGQGALCIQVRADDEEALAMAAAVACPRATVCTAAERAFLAGLDGSCRTPIGGLAVVEKEEVWFRGEVLSLDGAQRYQVERRFPFNIGDVAGAERMGAAAAGEARAAAGEDFFNRLADDA